MDTSPRHNKETMHDAPSDRVIGEAGEVMEAQIDNAVASLTWESYVGTDDVYDDDDNAFPQEESELASNLSDGGISDLPSTDEAPDYILHDEADFEYDQSDVVQESQRIIDISSFARSVGTVDSDEDSEADMVLTLEEVEHDEEASAEEAGQTATGTSQTDQPLRPGGTVQHGVTFCPIMAISKFPYKYVPPQYAEDVAGALFNGGKFWTRTFDLYYLWPITDIIPKPLIFIPSTQFDEVIFDINAAFPQLELDCRNPLYQELGLLLKFPEHPRLSPRLLGSCSSKDEYQRLVSFIPPPDYLPPGEMPCLKPDDRSLQAFQTKIEAVKLINTNKSKDRKVKRLQEKLKTNQKLGQQLARAQRYLGLRGEEGDDDLYTSIPINVTDPPAFPFEDDLILLAIDCEAYEEGAKPITEVGVISVDTRDLKGIPPGDGASDWFPFMYCRHIRIQEHAHLRNNKYLRGCPDDFEFGESEFVREKDAPRHIASCFRPPFCKVPQAGYKGPDISKTNNRAGASNTEADLDEAGTALELEQPEKRNILLVGHDPMQDVHYLQKLGYDPRNLSNLREIVDTAHMWRTYRQDTQTASLSNLLGQLGLVGWNLHNAGNDAAYTMQCFLAMCVKAASEAPEDQQLERQARRDAELKEKIEILKEEHALEQTQWAANDDGGGNHADRDIGSLSALKPDDQVGVSSSKDLGEHHLATDAEPEAVFKALPRPIIKDEQGIDVGISAALRALEPTSDADSPADTLDVSVVLDMESENQAATLLKGDQQTTDETWSLNDEAEMSQKEFDALQEKLNKIWKPIREEEAARKSADMKSVTD